MTAKAILKPGKDKRVYTLHPWIFRSDIDHVDGSFEPGDIVDIVSAKGRFLAKGYYNPSSQIALRIMTYRDEPVDRALIFRRVHDAIEYRRSFSSVAWRVISPLLELTISPALVMYDKYI